VFRYNASLSIAIPLKGVNRNVDDSESSLHLEPVKYVTVTYVDYSKGSHRGHAPSWNMNSHKPDSSPVEQPSTAQVEGQLARLVASESFSGALRSQGFLQFVVREALAGRQHRIGAYTIGVEVFDRPDDFDPRADPIVRVEAGRLRRRLERHYLTDGTDDPILIELPKGGYLPQVSYRDATGTTSIDADVDRDSLEEGTPSRRLNRIAIAALGLVMLIALSLALVRFVRPGLMGHSSSDTSPVLEESIVVLVLPFDYTADGDPHPFLANGLVEELIAALATLPDIDVIALGSAKQVTSDNLSPKEIAQALQVDYLIRGNVRQERSRLRLTVSVVEASNSVVQLSKSYDARLENILDLQAEIARDIAGTMAATLTPEFDHRLSTTGERESEVLALYYEATSLRDPPSDPVRSRLAEVAYRRVIELDPEFAGGYAGLAYVLAFRSWWGLSEQPDSGARKALEVARMAVKKDPDFGWAQMSLSIALNVSGDHDGSLRAAQQAARLSPSDPHVLAFSGMFHAFAGEVNAGMPLARSAIHLDPLSVRTPFRNITGVILFHAGRFEEALEVLDENLRLGGPDGPHMAYYRAATLARLERTEEARRELEKVEAFPYEFDMRNFLNAFRDPQEAGKLLDSLESVGFDSEELWAPQTR
jgi:TolB-like protein